ncbi:MAG TPA: glycosyltransferase family 4 protein, partial [Casimicrobiaceae bacterium]|nr:glycosyltransferase family 4 protein [Casimicrobiaceae bacterium]
EALLERNVAISLYTREWPQTRLQLIEPVICNPHYLGRLWRDWSFARAVCRALASAEVDLVQSHERLLCCDVYRAGDGVHAEWLEQRARVATPLERAATRVSPYHRHVLATERKLFTAPWLRAVICNSRMVQREIHERFGVPEDRLHVIYNAIDTDAFHPGLKSLRHWVRERHRIPDDAMVFLLVGSGYQRKGVATAIAALSRVTAPAHLLVVGRDRRLSHYADLARRHGVADRVTLAGPQTEPKPYYGAADAFVLPTLYDPCPNAALEAMACALPVITSTKSGAAELVREHDAGLVCDALDVDALAAHMQALVDQGVRVSMGARGRAAVAQLTPAAMTLKLVLLYRDLLTASVQARSASAGVDTATAAAAPGNAGMVAPEVLHAAGASDAASELPLEAALPEPPVLGPDSRVDTLPPEVGDAMAARDPRAG